MTFKLEREPVSMYPLIENERYKHAFGYKTLNKLGKSRAYIGPILGVS
jgi:hypothetical protein